MGGCSYLDDVASLSVVGLAVDLTRNDIDEKDLLGDLVTGKCSFQLGAE
jgi:hypothetical protein